MAGAVPPASTNPWLALQAGVDPAERVGVVRRAHEAFVRSGAVGGPVRGVVTESWRRSARAGVDPDTVGAPVDLTDADLEEYRAAHPLSAVVPVLREVLGGAYAAGDQIMAVSDAAGRLLWVEGHLGALRRAEMMNFVAGAWWDEPHIGTNAPGTALAVDHAVQIFASEHFSRAAQAWTCSAAPIHDPATGRLLGAVDITGGDQVANPHSLALVRAAARLAETYLAQYPPAAGPAVNLTALGRDEATVTGNGRRLVLSRRHSEIVALLACHPDGLTGDQLGLELYGDELNPVTLRAELSRLRAILGPHVLGSRPYRLRVAVDTDFGTVSRLLAAGALREALAAYRGPLLPGSQAPGVAAVRSRLEHELRASVLAAGDVSILDAWARTPSGSDDLVVWEALADRLPAGSPRRALASARVRDLMVDYGLLGGPGHLHATSLQRRRR
ncbi:transcriptional regulator [Planosporangium thailandense]|uniref:Transcriptional regulator n=1 Tax=Planosporangium thailandense TaxID=765197 RepID=A0ABX0Y1N5_9ACTN|nr:helix-turn-helix domain-containing protein [Planosporangium thailandense]NJC72269.1 transcriptional regulator [Planosporangium thailandense]